MSDLYATITTPNGVKYEQPLGLYVTPRSITSILLWVEG